MARLLVASGPGRCCARGRATRDHPTVPSANAPAVSRLVGHASLRSHGLSDYLTKSCVADPNAFSGDCRLLPLKTNGTDMPTTLAADVNKQTLLELYHDMQVIRQCEEQLARSHQKGLVHGACHTYVGEEAIAVGVCAHLGQRDVVFSTHRGHGHALAKGVTPRQLIAECSGAPPAARMAAGAACICSARKSA